MPRTDEAEAFFHAVYSAIQEIPYGKVTSYGHIAKLIGTREFVRDPVLAMLNPFKPNAPAKLASVSSTFVQTRP
jgi:alkylated DNA nucleotide flippase Atl1